MPSALVPAIQQFKNQPFSSQTGCFYCCVLILRITGRAAVSGFKRIPGPTLQPFISDNKQNKGRKLNLTPRTMEGVMELACLSALVTINSPMELVKCRFQTMDELLSKGAIRAQYQGFRDCLREIKVREGLRGYWKGNSIGLARFLPSEFLNNHVKDKFVGVLPRSVLSNTAAGVAGGWAAKLALYPFDTARLYISTSAETTAKTVKQLFGRVCCSGPGLLFRGYSNCLLGTALYRGAYFGVFETLKARACSTKQKWMAAYTASLTAALVVYPNDTITKKRILAKERQSSFKIVKQVLGKQGVTGLFRGASLVWPQSMCGAAVLMYFEQLKQAPQ